MLVFAEHQHLESGYGQKWGTIICQDGFILPRVKPAQNSNLIRRVSRFFSQSQIDNSVETKYTSGVPCDPLVQYNK